MENQIIDIVNDIFGDLVTYYNTKEYQQQSVTYVYFKINQIEINTYISIKYGGKYIEYSLVTTSGELNDNYTTNTHFEEYLLLKDLAYDNIIDNILLTIEDFKIIVIKSVELEQVKMQFDITKYTKDAVRRNNISDLLTD